MCDMCEWLCLTHLFVMCRVFCFHNSMGIVTQHIFAYILYSFVKNQKLHIEYTQFLLYTLTSTSSRFHIRYWQCSACVISLSFNAFQMGSATHYNDVIMGAMASQITSLTIVYSSVYSGAEQRKHESSASLAFVPGIHRWPVNSPHQWPVTRKIFHMMTSSRLFNIMGSSLLSIHCT